MPLSHVRQETKKAEHRAPPSVLSRQPLLLLLLRILRRAILLPRPLPVRYVAAGSAGDDQHVIAYVLRHGGAGADGDAVADSYRSDDLGVGADKHVIADYRLEFMKAVIVASDGAGPDVDALSESRVAEIGEVP